MQGTWFGARVWQPAEPVAYRVRWNVLLAKIYEVDGHACSVCNGRLRPVELVEPARAAALVKQGRIGVLKSTGPPDLQLALALPG